MNKEYQYSERIDAYLRNELSAAERADFEHLVSQDPLLYNEFVLQQEIVSGIQEYRKQQLKSRLNQIEVTSSSSLNGSTAGIIVGGLALIGLLGWWGYTHTTEPASAVAASEPVVVAPVVPPQPAPVQAAQTDSHAQGNTADKSTPAVPVRKPAKARKLVYTQPVELTVPQSDSKKDLQEEIPVKKSDTEIVQRKAVAYNAQASSAPRLNVIDNTNKSLTLHYCYQNGRIALLGFEKPYTFLDMPSENITYLYYENNFYKLNTQQTTPAPIEQVRITDQKLIDSLQIILKDRK